MPKSDYGQSSGENRFTAFSFVGKNPSATSSWISIAPKHGWSSRSMAASITKSKAWLEILLEISNRDVLYNIDGVIAVIVERLKRAKEREETKTH